MSQDAATIAARYFETWKAKDFTAFRSLLADDVDFVGPLARIDNADDCLKGIKGMSTMITDIVILKVFVDGPDVLTWFELHTAKTDPLPTANWSHVESGKITRIRVTFDPRPLTDPPTH